MRNYVTPEGMVKENALSEYMAGIAAERKRKGEGPPTGDAIVLFKKGDQVGFAKARKDIDWVDDSRKVK